ncbi:hypothetical protein EYF80_034736 [Liparis tanakae]|uniref:Uncharacterized protein n=1 Tax=Liparis tanakae TaxID=230148 RepID=A0A4Z2GP81_9TELE|nr:hypothetical protein EYF80_034736 [Liparis tanakae]
MGKRQTVNYFVHITHVPQLRQEHLVTVPEITVPQWRPRKVRQMGGQRRRSLGRTSGHRQPPRGRREDGNLSPSMPLHRLPHCTGSKGVLGQAGPGWAGLRSAGEPLCAYSSVTLPLDPRPLAPLINTPWLYLISPQRHPGLSVVKQPETAQEGEEENTHLERGEREGKENKHQLKQDDVFLHASLS